MKMPSSSAAAAPMWWQAPSAFSWREPCWGRSPLPWLPLWDKAFTAIVEHRLDAGCGAFDHDNKGFKAVVNALKGRLFPDDNQFELSLGLFTVQDEESCCHIYVLPFEEAGDFLYRMAAELL